MSIRIYGEKSLLLREEFGNTDLLDQVTGTVLDYTSGIGLAAEYLARNECDVEFISTNPLVRSFRNAVVPYSTVKIMKMPSLTTYDYVIVENDGQYNKAKPYAIRGIVRLDLLLIENLNDTSNHIEDNEPEPEDVSDFQDDRDE